MSMTSDELLTAAQALVGQEGGPTTTWVELGAIARFAEAVGDLNPLYLDEEVAKASLAGAIIAPPTFLCALPTKRPTLPIPPGGGILNGGNTYTFVRRLRVGDVITTNSTIAEAQLKPGKMGQMLFIALRLSYTDQQGQSVGTGKITAIIHQGGGGATAAPQGNPNTQLSAAALSGFGFPVHPFTPSPQPTGAGASEGMALPPLVKAPLTTMQLVKYAAASGDFYPIHYDKDFALSVGLPGIIAHGLLKMGFLAQHVTTWMGPAGEIRQLSASYRGMDFPGDILTSQGLVTKATPTDNGRHCVSLDLSLQNQRGEKNTLGTALVELPG